MNSALRPAGVGVMHATRASRVDQSERSIDDTLLLEDRLQLEAILTKLSHGNVTTQRFVNQRNTVMQLSISKNVNVEELSRFDTFGISLGLCPTG